MKNAIGLLLIVSIVLNFTWLEPCQADTNDITDGVALGVLCFGLSSYLILRYTIEEGFDEFLSDKSEEAKRRLARSRRKANRACWSLLGLTASGALFLEKDKRIGYFIPLVFLTINISD